MPIKFIDADEWYPVFSLTDDEAYRPDYKAEFSEEELNRIKTAFSEFDWAQDLIRERIPK